MYRYGKHMKRGAHRGVRAFWLVYLVSLLMVAGMVSAVAEGDERVGSTKAESTTISSFASTSSVLTTQDLTTGLTATDVVDTLLGTTSAATVSNVTFSGAGIAGGQFSGGPFGLSDGVILSSGDIANVEGPNTVDSVTANLGTPGDADLNSLIPGFTTFDATILEFDFDCGEVPVFSFDYVFASDEYNEYVNTSFNDVFGFFLDGTNIALLPDGVTPVSINNVNNGNPLGTNASNPSLYNNNDLQDGGPFFDTEADGFTVVLSATAALTPGPHHIKLAIADAGDRILDSWVMIEGGSFQCASPNTPPTVDAGSDVSGTEGSLISLDGTVTDPDVDDTVATSWSYTAGGNVDAGATCAFGDASAVDTTITCTDDGTYTVTLTGNDGTNPAVSDTATVTVTNVAPTITSITGPTDPVAVSTTVGISAPFTDPGANDTQVCTIDWGDGTTDSVVDPATTPCDGSHSYTAAGIHTVTVTVTDDDGDSDTEIFQYVVVYDPAAGFVTGGGWIDSPAGAYTADLTLTGKANFGFVSKYKKGANVPDGQTQFQFQAGDLNFHSTVYEWLVVAGPKGQYKGSGTINGSGDYGFMLTVTDGQQPGGGDVDKFRIKIWDKSTDAIIYDNQFGDADGADASTVLGGGSIVIHASKK